MTNTDSGAFMDIVPSISLRENEAGMHTGAVGIPRGISRRRLRDVLGQDFRLGLNAAQTTLSAVAQLTGAKLQSRKAGNLPAFVFLFFFRGLSFEIIKPRIVGPAMIPAISDRARLFGRGLVAPLLLSRRWPFACFSAAPVRVRVFLFRVVLVWPFSGTCGYQRGSCVHRRRHYRHGAAEPAAATTVAAESHHRRDRGSWAALRSVSVRPPSRFYSR